MAKDYRLIPEDIPSIMRVATYNRILEDFLASNTQAVRVDIPRKKPSTIYQGLLKAKRGNGRFASVSVVRRKDTVYLRAT